MAALIVMAYIATGCAAVITLAVVMVVHTIRRSDRPRADKWAAWSLFLGMASYPVSYLLAALLAAPLAALLSEHWSPGGQGADVAGKAVLVVCGLFPILAGIKALLAGASRWMAVSGIVLGGVTLAVGVVGIADIAGPHAIAGRAVHDAAALGDTEALALLLEAGADVNARNERGWTPLHRAVNRGHMDVVQMLLEAGADVNAKHTTGQTPMSFARTEEMKGLLRQHGAGR